MDAPWAIDPNTFFIDHIEKYSCHGTVSVTADPPPPLAFSDRGMFMAAYREGARELLSRLAVLGVLPAAAMEGLFRTKEACSGVLDRMVREGVVSRISWSREGRRTGTVYRLTEGYIKQFCKEGAAVRIDDGLLADTHAFLSLLPLTHFGAACMGFRYHVELHMEETVPFLLAWDRKRLPLIAVSIRTGDDPFHVLTRLLEKRRSYQLWPDGIVPERLRKLAEEKTGQKVLPYYLAICESFRHMERCAREVLGRAGLERIPYLYFGYDSLTCLDKTHRSYSVAIKDSGELVLSASKVGFAKRK